MNTTVSFAVSDIFNHLLLNHLRFTIYHLSIKTAGGAPIDTPPAEYPIVLFHTTPIIW